MRSVFLKDFKCKINESIGLEGEDFHHLSKVVRIRKNEEILILNGRGERYFSTVSDVSKRQIELLINKIDKISEKKSYKLLLCLPKKNYLDEILKSAVEIGVTEVQFVYSEYSQRYEIKPERISRILKQAYQQSNNPYILNVLSPLELKNLDFKEFSNIFFFNSLNSKSQGKIDSSSESAILIGPEGGFSDDEQDFLRTMPNIREIYIKNTWILRAQTAVGYAYGLLDRFSL